ncbi:hypothetical protein ACFO0N_18550 [Halobium salinum]|uniref:Branched-chain amino acid ABC transporter permease n=1 Tax=Halobium salinum TaxID=1364940 RepID=A0ABD5PGY1_9EURY|nr:hypothetical protein [Halobium salinum]
MSGASTTASDRTSAGASAFAVSAAEMAVAPLRFVGFWAAIAFPFLYVPLLMGGLEGNEATVFLALLVVNALALLVGHGYNRDA